MTIVVVGHGIYGTAMKTLMKMLIGEHPDYHFVDFAENDTIESLTVKLETIIEVRTHEEVIFSVDLLGGTPFRVCAALSSTHQNFVTLAGINPTGLLEVAYSLDQGPETVVMQMLEASREGIIMFPESFRSQQ